uniref:Uncharacterized protein n=1 Tax=Romanomermis culicivorax TaxID=13658 RepID=A0A915HZQ7_ROMCU
MEKRKTALFNKKADFNMEKIWKVFLERMEKSIKTSGKTATNWHPGRKIQAIICKFRNTDCFNR